jgi:hypothetical protein
MMQASTPRPLSIACAFFGLFIGGALVGLGLARLLAPGSWWADALSGFALPLAFVLSLQAWFGLALLSLIPRLVRRLLGRDPWGSAPPLPPIPGAAAFVPISSAIGLVVGIAVGWLSATHALWLVASVYWLVGTFYGLLAWRLARAGLLLPPENV